jgi:hypothetical protein
MSCTQESKPAIEIAADKGPYKKRAKPCIVCGKPSVGVTSYVFQANGRNRIGVPFCRPHIDGCGIIYATPVFENQDALNIFKKEHPGIYNRSVKGKIILFLNPLKTSGETVQ